MKKLLLVMGLCSIFTLANAQEQTRSTQHYLQDNKHALVAYVTVPGPKIYDKDNKLVFQIANGAITDNNNMPLGYITNGPQNGPEYQDKDHKAIGYLTHEGTVENSNHQVLGYLNYDGSYAVEDPNHKVIGFHYTEPMWAAAYFFFYH